MNKRIVFLTGTRADFGKLKSLIEITNDSKEFEVHVFATGMHLQRQYGGTVHEIQKCGYENIFQYINHTSEESMDLTLASTIQGLSNFCREINPDLIVIHGDRVEALAGAIVGSLNNILVAHIEGGEVSGTIDELIRHSVSKMSHSHFVANQTAQQRLIQMGEEEQSIFIIGSPDVDVMLSHKLPSLEFVKDYYEIPFEKYAVVLFHPVTTEISEMEIYANEIVSSLINSDDNYVVIYPNNDLGSNHIIEAYDQLEGNERFKVFPSLRFEYFLVLLKHAQFLVGNSSAGIREAPYYGLPVINIGTRQTNRSNSEDIVNCDYTSVSISNALSQIKNHNPQPVELFGEGNSDKLFYDIIKSEEFWSISKQKTFKDLPNNGKS